MRDIGKFIKIKNKYKLIEYGIIKEVMLLNKFGVQTIGSCEGHGSFKWIMVKTYNDLYKAMKIFKDFNITDVKLIDPNVNGKMKLSGYFYNGVSFDFVL